MLDMNRVTLGIDISKATFDVALYQDDQYQVGHFSNDQSGCKKLIKWLARQEVSDCYVCIEATGRYGEEVALFLHEAAYQVSVVNPARIKSYANSQLKRNKTDREDANVIAHFWATQKPGRWTPPAPAVRELQQLVRRLDRLKSMRTQESNRRQAGKVSAAVLASIDDHLAYLMAQIKLLERQIKNLIDEHPELKQQQDLLITIQGINDTTAAKFLAEIPDIHQFKSAAQLAAYAGLTPRQKFSGTSVRGQGHLSKMGNAHLRTAMFMPQI